MRAAEKLHNDNDLTLSYMSKNTCVTQGRDKRNAEKKHSSLKNTLFADDITILSFK